MQHNQFSPTPIIDIGSFDHFRLNPFRVLSLHIDSDTQEAGWAAERLAAMAAAGIETDRTHLSVLGSCSEAEIRHAATQLEEPLERLVAELFWFDYSQDPQSTLLESYLQNADTDALETYLATDEPDQKTTANVLVNRANLALLLGLLTINDIANGAKTSATDPSPDGEIEKKKKFKWKKVGDLSIVENPHLLLAKWQKQRDVETSGPEWAKHLESALLNWQNLLKSDDWPALVREKTERLQDDLLDEGTPELLSRIIPGRLADLVAGEIKKAVSNTDFRTAGLLLETAYKSGFDIKTLRNALAQTRVLFQNEIRQAEELLGEDPDDYTLQDISAYLKSLAKLKKQWSERSLDTKDDLLGLRYLMDEAANRGFRAISNTELMHSTLYEKQQLLDMTAEIASSRSLQERVYDFRDSIVEAYEGLVCHFCQKNAADPDCPVVLKGKKQTRHDYSNNTIYFSILFAYVPRCNGCCNLFEFINNWGLTLSMILYVGTPVLLFPSENAEGFLWIFIGGPLIILSFSASAAGYVLQIPYFIASYFVALAVTPNSHRKYNDVHTSKSALNLLREGYDIDDIMLSRNAGQNAQNQVNNR